MSAALEFPLLFAFFLVVGVSGMPPSVTFGDSGEFSAAAAVLGLPHSPGYPLFCLLGRAFGSALPWGAWAYRLNLFSAACGAAGLAVFAAALRRAGFSPAPRLCAALALGLSPLWRYENSVTEVFSLHLLACSGLWLIVELGAGAWNRKSMAALGLALGLGLANHHTLVLSALALPLAFNRSWPPRFLRAAAWAAGFGLLGMLCYLYLPLRSRQLPPLDWGHPTSIESFLHVLLRRDYGSFSLTVGGSAGGWGTRLFQVYRYFTFTARELGLPTLLLALAGFVSWPGLGLRPGRMFPLAWLVFSGPFFLFVGNPPFDAQTTGALDRFYLGSWLGLAALAAAGLQAVSALHPAAARALCLAPGLWSAYQGAGLWARGDYAAYDYGKSILRTLPPGASLYMDGGDDTFYSLAYLSYAEGRRPDLDLHDRGGLVYPNPYGPGFRALPARLKEERRRSIESPLAARGTLYYSTVNEAILPGFKLIPWGLLRIPLRGEPESSWSDPWAFIPERWSEGLLRRRYRDRALVAFYPFMRGQDFLRRGDLRPALLSLRRAAALGGDALWLRQSMVFPAAVIGFKAAQARDWPLAEEAYAFASRHDPNAESPLLGLGVVCENTGRRDQAEAYYRRVLAVSPDSGQAHYNLGALYWASERWRESAAEFSEAARLRPEDASWRQFAQRAASRAAAETR